MDNSAFDARKRRAIRNLEERWEELAFENDFVFGAVLQSDLDLCRRVLETVLDMPTDLWTSSRPRGRLPRRLTQRRSGSTYTPPMAAGLSTT